MLRLSKKIIIFIKKHAHPMFNNITGCPLFTGLSKDQIEFLLNSNNFNIKRYDKGDSVVYNGEEVVSQLIVAEGCVKAEMIDIKGKTLKVEDIESPRLIAPGFLFGRNVYPVDVISSCPTKILSISKSSFVKIMQSNETVLLNYLEIVSGRAQFLSEKIRYLSFKSLKSKFIGYILDLSIRLGKNEFKLDKSIVVLSEIFGVARPSLSRVISELNDEGVVEITGKYVKINNRDQLLHLSD